MCYVICSFVCLCCCSCCHRRVGHCASQKTCTVTCHFFRITLKHFFSLDSNTFSTLEVAMRCRTVLFHPLLTYLIMLLVREKFLADSRGSSMMLARLSSCRQRVIDDDRRLKRRDFSVCLYICFAPHWAGAINSISITHISFTRYYLPGERARKEKRTE